MNLNFVIKAINLFHHLRNSRDRHFYLDRQLEDHWSPNPLDLDSSRRVGREHRESFLELGKYNFEVFEVKRNYVRLGYKNNLYYLGNYRNYIVVIICFSLENSLYVILKCFMRCNLFLHLLKAEAWWHNYYYM